MKIAIHAPSGRGQGSIVNQEVIRARAVTAELKSNIKKAHELRHTARNLITVHRLLLEEIHLSSRRNVTNHEHYFLVCAARQPCCSEIIR
jgi:hypothetical protein